MIPGYHDEKHFPVKLDLILPLIGFAPVNQAFRVIPLLPIQRVSGGNGKLTVNLFRGGAVGFGVGYSGI